ncbi:type II toxin-antitoxin system RelE/ParE family toxin [Duganella aceris]|uniref:Killer protein n=1 Tax=Duganella aceris TaxID=2703883 RepID=A0ABX0FF86_9BURK|nr:type II toxin-antitoxin system RelE/ParE family toxin [Duganella aceris]NGZ83195.1 Killer protein [Duganella aceris]
MISSFKHKGLLAFFCNDDRRAMPTASAARISRILDRLDACSKPEDMDVPGYKFHPLKGNRTGAYAVAVSGNLRVTFRFDDGNAIEVNLEDYH